MSDSTEGHFLSQPQPHTTTETNNTIRGTKAKPKPAATRRTNPMAGVSYGKGAPVDEAQVRWLTPEDIDERIASGARLRLIDARDKDKEFCQGSLPGAISLGQTDLMFNRESYSTLIDELVRGSDEIVLFANTGGPNTGMTSGRDVAVLYFLFEMGVPYARMARLTGGLRGWADSGRPTPVPPRGGAGLNISGGLAAFLCSIQLDHLAEPLLSGGERDLAGLAALLASDRGAFLQRMKDVGVTKLPERQKLANAIARASREGAVSAMSPRSS
jgi:hypothetical protein